jgi:hypothetical protein
MVYVMPDFDPMEPFANETLKGELIDELSKFEYKLYGQIPLRFHRGAPTKYEFDLNLGVVHFTEQDFRGLSELFARINGKWHTEMTFCVYPSKEKARDMILNVRGSPMAPAEID